MSLTDDYRHSPRPIPIPITSVEEYEAAMARARELMSANRGDINEDELVKIGDAVVAWYKRHDDATASVNEAHA